MKSVSQLQPGQQLEVELTIDKDSPPEDLSELRASAVHQRLSGVLQPFGDDDRRRELGRTSVRLPAVYPIIHHAPRQSGRQRGKAYPLVGGNGDMVLWMSQKKFP